MAKVRKAVIPAAGRGTRQYPASSAVPKEMFPLVDRDGVAKPIIQMIAEEAVESGIEQICIICAPGREAVYRDYFRRLDDDLGKALEGKAWAMRESEKLASIGERLSFAEQSSPQGFGHAVYQAKQFVGDEPFLLLLGDHVYISDTKERCARQIVRAFEQHLPQALSAVASSPESQLHLFGTIKGAPMGGDRGIYRAELIIEKPTVDEAREKLATPGLAPGNYLTHFGMHIFSPGIFESLERLIRDDRRQGAEIQLTAAQEYLRQRAGQYLCLEIQGQRYDTGIPFGLVETQLALGLNGIDRAAVQEAIPRILGRQSCFPIA